MSMSHQHWSELSPLKRVAIVKLVVLDLGSRTWALIDLAHRPKNQVRGSKTVWALALTLVSSVGILPTIYLTRARKTD